MPMDIAYILESLEIQTPGIPHMEHIAHIPADQKPVSDRKFGLLFSAIFLALGLWPLIKAQPAWHAGLALSALFAAMSTLVPAWLKPLRRIWMLLGTVMHRVTSPILLGAVFILVFIPVGLLWRCTGKDPLHLKLDRSSPSYWIPRNSSNVSPESLKHIF